MVNDCYVRWLEVRGKYEGKPHEELVRLLHSVTWRCLLAKDRDEKAEFRGGGHSTEELVETITPAAKTGDEETRILVNDVMKVKITPREREVCELLKHRRKATEIARELGLSRDQVVRITRSIRKKFEKAGLDNLLPK